MPLDDEKMLTNISIVQRELLAIPERRKATESIPFIVLLLIWLMACLPVTAQEFWEPTTHEFEGSVDVIHLTDRGTVLAGVFIDGIYRLGSDSVWTKVHEGTLWGMAEQDDALFAATTDGVLHSTDDGRTWTPIMLGSAYAVYVNGSTIVAGGGGGQFYVTRDAGSTWEVPSWVMMPLGLDDLVTAVFAAGDHAVYDHIFEGSVISVDGGDTWMIDEEWRPDFFWRDADGLTYSVRDGSVVNTSDGVEWNVFSDSPLFSIDQFRRRGNLVSASSIFGAAYSIDAGGSWVAPGGLPVEEDIESLAIGTDGHLYAGTSCCVRRSSTPLGESVGTSLANVEPPVTSELKGTFPNPAADLARVPFVLEKASQIRIEVYDVSGRLVDTLVDRTLAAGAHELLWHANNYAPGAYFIRMYSAGRVDSETVTVIR